MGYLVSIDNIYIWRVCHVDRVLEMFKAISGRQYFLNNRKRSAKSIMDCVFRAPAKLKKADLYHQVHENVEQVLTLTPLLLILTPLRDAIHV